MVTQDQNQNGVAPEAGRQSSLTCVEDDRVKPSTMTFHRLLERPFCDAAYHHVFRVGTELDPDEGELSIYEGTSLVFERESGERRSALRIDFEGECGHNWTLLFQQHKGFIYVSTRNSARRVEKC